jgi:clan AA aspartic protease
MGKVMNRIKLTNQTDLDNAVNGLIGQDQIRSIELEALVDTGASCLAIPAEAARALGLRDEGKRFVRLADGRSIEVSRVLGIRLEILGRDMTCDALVLPEGTTALIGQIPLEALDLIVDPRAQEVRVNPEHPDGPVLDLLRCA